MGVWSKSRWFRVLRECARVCIGFTHRDHGVVLIRDEEQADEVVRRLNELRFSDSPHGYVDLRIGLLVRTEDNLGFIHGRRVALMHQASRAGRVDEIISDLHIHV